jgi:tRNA1Val (adenine37-N6)-methyltransferase
MKVCTDSCVFGAWVATLLADEPNNEAGLKILDIGAGSGLLSLMVAQKVENSIITAVEPDEGSAKDCSENFQKSPWKSRLLVKELDIESFSKLGSGEFDVIICNPPFFLNHMVSPSDKRSKAMHLDLKSWEIWISLFDKLLNESGRLFLLIPDPSAALSIEMLRKASLNLQTQIIIHQRKQKNWRHLLEFKRSPAGLILRNETFLHGQNKGYSEMVKNWLSDYYLIFLD